VFKLAAARSTLVEHIVKGGMVMIPILLVGLVAAVMAAWKLADVSRLRVESGEGAVRVLDALRRGDADGARGIAASLGEPMAPVYLEGIEHRGASEEHLEEMLTERILACVPRLERNLGALAVLGGVAPLLGLLGTVTGMIHTFQLITVFGSGDPKLLSRGIAEALITTEYGLYIAIPVVLAHAYLARRVRTIVGAMERRAAEFVHGLKVGGSGR